MIFSAPDMNMTQFCKGLILQTKRVSHGNFSLVGTSSAKEFDANSEIFLHLKANY